MISRTPNTFIVGAGQVATVLAGSLRRRGVPVLGIWGRDAAKVRIGGNLAGVAAYSSAPPDLMLEAQVVIVAVSDHAISQVANMLVGTGLVSKKHLFLHCSGSLSAEDAFAEIRDRVAGIGVLHPLRSISDPASLIGNLAGTVFGVQGDELGLRFAKSFAELLEGVPLELSGESMVNYHAAAVMASNYLVTLIDVGVQLMKQTGVDERTATFALSELAKGALDNVRKNGIADSLAGPIRRGDIETVNRHLSAIPDGTKDIYKMLGARTAALIRRECDPVPPDLDAIEQRFSDDS